jgi:hypothetical protein
MRNKESSGDSCLANREIDKLFFAVLTSFGEGFIQVEATEINWEKKE